MSRAFVAACLILAACVAAFWPSFQVLIGYWNDTRAMGMTHGWLIAAIVLWLLWRERGTEKGTVPLAGTVPFSATVPFSFAVLWACLAMLLALWLVWVVALRAGLQIVHLALVPPLAWLAVTGALGRPAGRRFAYPLAYFYFAIPLWGNLTPPLQWTTIYAVRFMLRVTGVPAYFQGNVVQIPDGHFNIVGGCSGLHYFLVSLAVASLYAHIHRDPPRRHLAIVAIAAVAAILLNWVRVYCVILSGHLTHMQSFLVRVDHYWFGWGLFGIAMTLALWVASRVLPAVEPLQATGAARQTSGSPRWQGVAAVLGVLAVLGVAVQAAGRADRTATVPDVTGPLERAGIQPVQQMGTGTASVPVPSQGTVPVHAAPDAATWQPRFKGAAQEFHGATHDGAVLIYVAVYPTQHQGAELGYYRNSVTGRGLEELSSGRRDDVAWTHAEDSQQNRWLIWTVYSVGSRRFADPTLAQVYYALRSVRGAAPSAVVSVATRCDGDCAGREATLSSALNQALAPVSEVLSSRAP